MRFYEIQLTPTGTKTATGVSQTGAVFTSYPNGQNDPNALNIELDIPVAPFGDPLDTSAWIRIWGVSLAQISQAADFNGAKIKVYGGMKAGFPLANPAQSGLLTEGVVWQAYGNWVGTDMSLELLIRAGPGAPDEIKNIVWNWPKGSSMADAIAATLNTAEPTIPQDIQINEKLILGETDAGFYPSLATFSQHIRTMSQTIIGGDYQGVSIRLHNEKFYVYDYSVDATARVIAFNDLIGQPTWIEPLMIQLNCVLRSDITPGDLITIPTTRTTANSSLVDRNDPAFIGKYRVNSVRHVGNFRQPDGNSWITVIEGSPVKPLTVT